MFSVMLLVFRYKVGCDRITWNSGKITVKQGIDYFEVGVGGSKMASRSSLSFSLQGGGYWRKAVVF